MDGSVTKEDTEGREDKRQELKSRLFMAGSTSPEGFQSPESRMKMAATQFSQLVSCFVSSSLHVSNISD